MIFCQTPALAALSAARLAICSYQSADASQSTGILAEGLLPICPRHQKPATRNSLTALASYICGLFGALQKVNPRRISNLRVSFCKTPGVGVPSRSTFGHSNLNNGRKSFTSRFYTKTPYNSFSCRNYAKYPGGGVLLNDLSNEHRSLRRG